MKKTHERGAVDSALVYYARGFGFDTQ